MPTLSFKLSGWRPVSALLITWSSFVLFFISLPSFLKTKKCQNFVGHHSSNASVNILVCLSLLCVLPFSAIEAKLSPPPEKAAEYISMANMPCTSTPEQQRLRLDTFSSQKTFLTTQSHCNPPSQRRPTGETIISQASQNDTIILLQHWCCALCCTPNSPPGMILLPGMEGALCFRLQEKVRRIVQHRHFENCILFLVLASSLSLVSCA